MNANLTNGLTADSSVALAGSETSKRAARMDRNTLDLVFGTTQQQGPALPAKGTPAPTFQQTLDKTRTTDRRAAEDRDSSTPKQESTESQGTGLSVAQGGGSVSTAATACTPVQTPGSPGAATESTTDRHAGVTAQPQTRTGLAVKGTTVTPPKDSAGSADGDPRQDRQCLELNQETEGQGMELTSEIRRAGLSVASSFRRDRQGLQGTARHPTHNEAKPGASSSSTTEGEASADGQVRMKAAGAGRPSDGAAPGDTAVADSPRPASSIHATVAVSAKEALTHDGPSVLQSQTWPHAGLSIDSLATLAGTATGQVDESVMQGLGEGDWPSVQEQVISSIHQAVESQTHEVTVELNPPELGRVLIRFEHHQGSVIGWLEVDDPGTCAEIRRALPQIVQTLQENGTQVRRLDVTLNDQHPQSFKDPSFADLYHGRPGQQDQGHPWPYLDPATSPTNDPGAASQPAEAAGPTISIGATGSINMLV